MNVIMQGARSHNCFQIVYPKIIEIKYLILSLCSVKMLK
jgi:hypothetical protein